ncbi:MAG: hypothetical protein R2726_15185 [Acidimicrobiales bacterium]
MAYPSAAPAPAQKKGKGVLIGIILIVLSFVVFGVGIGVGVVSLAGVFSEFKTVGTGTSTVQLKSGEHSIYTSSSSFLNTPDVKIKAPSGADVPVSSSSSSSSYTNNSETYYATGTFDAPTDGTYTVTVSPDSFSGSSGFSSSSRTTVAIGPPTSRIGAAIALGLGLLFGGIFLGGFLFLIGLIVLIVGLVRRSKAKNPPTTPYGGYGGPGQPYGTPGYAAPSPGGVPGYASPPPAPGYGTPPPGPPGSPGAPPAGS